MKFGCWGLCGFSFMFDPFRIVGFYYRSVSFPWSMVHGPWIASMVIGFADLRFTFDHFVIGGLLSSDSVQPRISSMVIGFADLRFTFDHFGIGGFAFIRSHGFHPWLFTFDHFVIMGLLSFCLLSTDSIHGYWLRRSSIHV